MKYKIIALLLILLTAAFSFFFLGQKEERVEVDIAPRKILAKIEKVAADEVLLRFQRADGLSVDLRDFKGQKIILNLWASWCKPCLEELPELDVLQKEYKGKIKVIALNVENNFEVGKEAFDRLNLQDLDYFFDMEQTASSNLQVRGLPTSLVLNKELKAQYKISGYLNWESERAKELLE